MRTSQHASDALICTGPVELFGLVTTMPMLNPLMLIIGGLQEIIVWIYDIFDNNFGIQNYFTKYLKEGCSVVF